LHTSNKVWSVTKYTAIVQQPLNITDRYLEKKLKNGEIERKTTKNKNHHFYWRYKSDLLTNL